MPNIGSFAVSWVGIKDYQIAHWEAEPEDSRVLSEILVSNVSEDQELVILWNNGAVPTIGISCGLMVQNLERLLADADDMWILEPVVNFLVDFRTDGTILFGSLPLP
jgi:hypothetical protein